MGSSDIDGTRLEALPPQAALTYLADLARRTSSAAHAVLWAGQLDRYAFDDASGENNPRTLAQAQALCRQVEAANETQVRDGGASPTTPQAVGAANAETAAFLCIPIRDGTGRALGALCVCDLRPRSWSSETTRMLNGIAEAASPQVLRLREDGRQLQNEGDSGDFEASDDLPGLLFERRKITGGGWTYRFFDPSRKALSNFDERLGHDNTLSFIHADDRERVCRSLDHATDREVDSDLMFRVAAPDGTERWLRSKSKLRRDSDGSAVWDGLCFDVSDLVAAREAAEKARVSTEMLLADMNHELRAPLQAILGFAALLKSETEPAVVRSHAAIIETSAQSLLSIVNQILEMARGDEIVARQVERQPVDIRALAETCHGMVAPLAAEKGLRSVLTIDPDVPGSVLADGPKIQQVLVNLLNNAIKFTEAGSTELRISGAPAGLRFSVSDTGIGIAADKVGLLFQRFFRLERSDRSTRGTGLGLAIAKQLVESMDGEIGVASTSPRGTTFWFQIAAEPLVSPVAAHVTRPRSDGAARILLADDIDLNRKLIADMLSLEGFEVDCVNDGAAAVHAVTNYGYDLVLMDMIMPGMDGLAATRAIRALPAPTCDVPIVALTAHAFKEQLESCIVAGMNATLTKPMSLETLVATVKNWTDGHSAAA